MVLSPLSDSGEGIAVYERLRALRDRRAIFARVRSFCGSMGIIEGKEPARGFERQRFTVEFYMDF